MDAAAIAAIAVAVISAVSGYAIARRNTKPAQVAAEGTTANALLASYDAFADRLQQEVDRVRLDCERRIAAMEATHEHERQEWRAERDRLNERIDELGSQVYALQNRPPATRDRSTDA